MKMKIRFFLLISLLATTNLVLAQKMVTSAPKYFYIQHSHTPPTSSATPIVETPNPASEVPIAPRPVALYINAISTTTPFEEQAASSVLAIYKNEFGKYEMPEKDETFPYTVFRVRLQGAPNLIRLAKQTLMLNLGQMFQTEQTVTSYNNMILFLIPSGAKNVYLTCGDGCEQQLIYSGRLMANKIYDGVIEVK